MNSIRLALTALLIFAFVGLLITGTTWGKERMNDRITGGEVRFGIMDVAVAVLIMIGIFAATKCLFEALVWLLVQIWEIKDPRSKPKKMRNL